MVATFVRNIAGMGTMFSLPTEHRAADVEVLENGALIVDEGLDVDVTGKELVIG